MKHKTGAEVFVLIIRRINEEIFLAFAGIHPFFVTENEDVAQRMITEYFPEGAEDVISITPEEILYEEYEKDYEEKEEAEELEEDIDYAFYWSEQVQLFVPIIYPKNNNLR